ncbi:MAG TPA: hypothetical protein VLK22_04400 [Candidatus Udaeobacter sp.]|nr:hypothetical protein [Candidatus Udaeobacter sp.]
MDLDLGKKIDDIVGKLLIAVINLIDDLREKMLDLREVIRAFVIEGKPL